MFHAWILSISEPVALAVVLLFSTLAYPYLDALRMLRRQAFLSHVYRPEGAIRRWFWDSLWLRIVYSITAVIAAVVAFLFFSRLSTQDAWVLGFGCFSFLLVFRFVYGVLHNETQPQFLSLVALRVSAWINLGVMAFVLAVVQIVWLEVPDTRHLQLTELISSSWQQHSAEPARVPAVGWLLSIAAVMHDASWHLMQQASRLETGVGFKLAAWFAVLFVNALKLGSLQLLLLGIASLGIQVRQQGWPAAQKQLLRGSYWLTVLALILLYLAFSRGPGWFERRPALTGSEAVTQVDKPCSEPSRLQQQANASAQVRGHLAEQEQAAALRIERYIHEVVRRAFVQAESGVDGFLDWNFSIKGQYQQLGYLAAATAGTGISEGSTRFSNYLSEHMNTHIGEPLAPALIAAQADIQQVFMAEVRSSGVAYSRLLNQVVAQSSCIPIPSFSFQPSQYIDKSLVGLGVAGGAIALRFATAAGSRAAGRAGMRRALAALFTRGAARAGAVGSGSAGAFCGPAFWLCTPAIIAGTWISIDYGLNKADEMLNREQMRTEMLASLQADSEAAAAELTAFYTNALATFYRELDTNQQRQFNIRRDGL